MGYRQAMETAGAEVLAYETFGDYQGTWIAKVRYNGIEGWVSGSYGSCSGCDAYEADIGSSYHKCGDITWHSPEYDGYNPGCPDCDERKEKVRAFGAHYLEDILSQEEIEAKFSPDIEDETDWRGYGEILAYITINPVATIH